MKRKVERKQSIERYRARGRGRKVFWVVVLGAVLIAGAGFAKGFGHGHARAGHDSFLAAAASPEQLAGRIDDLLDHLAATDAQRERIHGLVAELAPELADLAAQRDALRERVVAALLAEELPATDSVALEKEVGEQSARLTERTLSIAFAIASELTPEQRSRLFEHRDRH